MTTVSLTTTASSNHIKTDINGFKNTTGSVITLHFSDETSEEIKNGDTSLPYEKAITAVNLTATFYYPISSVTLTHNKPVIVTYDGNDIVFTW